MDTDSLSEELELGQSEDPRQTYLSALFAPGAFLASTLAKTVAIFRQSRSGGIKLWLGTTEAGGCLCC